MGELLIKKTAHLPTEPQYAGIDARKTRPQILLI
jgi:hypothetical protein